MPLHLSQARMFIELFTVLTALNLWLKPSSIWPSSEKQLKLKTPHLAIPDAIQRNWGQYSPWFPVEPYSPPPDGCTVTQVHIVSLINYTSPFPNFSPYILVIASSSKGTELGILPKELVLGSKTRSPSFRMSQPIPIAH